MTDERSAAGMVWIDICQKLYDAAKIGEMERVENLITFSKLFEDEYPTEVQAERDFWQGALNP